MSSSYGIYGPVFELMDNVPHELREENKNSEKYELKNWNFSDPDSLRPLITQVNKVRLENPALRNNRSLLLHGVDNDQLLAYSKQDGDNRILCVVNFDDSYTQSGFVDIDLGALELPQDEPYSVQDLLTGEHYTWQGSRNYVELGPQGPAHIFRLSGRSDQHAAQQRAI